VGYMKRMWAEMLLEPQLPDTAESIYSQAIDEAIDILETTQKRGVFTDHKLALAWQALRVLKQAKEKADGYSQE
jgi:transcription initiation factor IIE alpha subunit